MYRSLRDAIRDAELRKITLARLALETESKDQGRPVEEIRAALKRALDVMRHAIAEGLTGEHKSASGLVGGDAAKVRTGPADAKKIGDEQVVDALATAGLIGAVIAERASLSGAEGGCQAETGAA